MRCAWYRTVEKYGKIVSLRKIPRLRGRDQPRQLAHGQHITTRIISFHFSTCFCDMLRPQDPSCWIRPSKAQQVWWRRARRAEAFDREKKMMNPSIERKRWRRLEYERRETDEGQSRNSFCTELLSPVLKPSLRVIFIGVVIYIFSLRNSRIANRSLLHMSQAFAGPGLRGARSASSNTYNLSLLLCTLLILLLYKVKH